MNFARAARGSLSIVSSSSSFSRRLASFATRPQKDVDVLIIGGGPAGLALASALGSSALDVVLVEAADLSKVRTWSLEPSIFSNRVSSLTNASQLFLRGCAGVQRCLTCSLKHHTQNLALGIMSTTLVHVLFRICRCVPHMQPSDLAGTYFQGLGRY